MNRFPHENNHSSRILGAFLLPGLRMAQDDIPLLRPDERAAVDAQTEEFNQSLVPALTDAAKSTVRVWSGNRRLAYGTVIGDGNRILTKWSEVAAGEGRPARGVIRRRGEFQREFPASMRTRTSRFWKSAALASLR